MPQWNFLNFLSEKGKAFPHFHLKMETKGVGILKENGKVIGVKAQSKEGEFSIFSDLVVAADGRDSVFREKAGLTVKNLGAPVDVLWFRLSKPSQTEQKPFLMAKNGKLFVMIDRGDYWQCAYVIVKGGYEAIKEKGMEHFQDQIKDLIPALSKKIVEIDNWNQVKKLSVTVDRLEKWYVEGLLCIGDSAHAMSPIGGVGINLAIQDAVAAANTLVPAFHKGIPTEGDLQKIQKRRMFPTKFTQRFQTIVQNNLIISFLKSHKKMTRTPWVLKLFKWFPFLRILPARFIGLGIRSEKITFLKP